MCANNIWSLVCVNHGNNSVNTFGIIMVCTLAHTGIGMSTATVFVKITKENSNAIRILKTNLDSS